MLGGDAVVRQRVLPCAVLLLLLFQMRNQKSHRRALHLSGQSQNDIMCVATITIISSCFTTTTKLRPQERALQNSQTQQSHAGAYVFLMFLGLCVFFIGHGKSHFFVITNLGNASQPLQTFSAHVRTVGSMWYFLLFANVSSLKLPNWVQDM